MASQPNLLTETGKEGIQRERQDSIVHFNELFKCFYTIKVEIYFSGFPLSYTGKGGGG